MEPRHGGQVAGELREYGFTTASGLPVIAYRGFQDGSARIRFHEAISR